MVAKSVLIALLQLHHLLPSLVHGMEEEVAGSGHSSTVKAWGNGARQRHEKASQVNLHGPKGEDRCGRFEIVL